jgi:hypothetical protein
MSEMVTVSTMATIAATALAWLLTYAMHSTLLLTAAWGVTRRLGRRSLVLQETIWRCALVGGIVTASMQLAFAQVGRTPVVGGWTLAPGAAVETSAAMPAPALPGSTARVSSSASFAAATGEDGARRANAPGECLAASAAAGEVLPAAAKGRDGGGTSMDAGERSGMSLRGALPAGAQGIVTDAPGMVTDASGKVASAPGTVAGAPGTIAHATARRGAVWPAGRILAAWLVAAFLLSAAYLRSYYLLRRRLRYRPRVVGGAVLPRLARLVGETGIARTVRLTCTWRLRVPVALGGRAAEICVPPRALFQLSDEQQDALLAHELAHLVRRDSAWLMITQLMVTLFFFQPFNWLARRCLRELSELVCDQWAVAQTGRPLSLAGCLAEVAAWSIGPRRHAHLPVPGMADRPSQLAYRIRRLLDGTPLEGRSPVRRDILCLAVGVLAVVALVAPGISAGSTAATPPAAPAVALSAAPTVAAPAASAGAVSTASSGATAAASPGAVYAARAIAVPSTVACAIPVASAGAVPAASSVQPSVAAESPEGGSAVAVVRQAHLAAPAALIALPRAVMVVAAMAQPAPTEAAPATEATPASPAAPSLTRPDDTPRVAPAAPALPRPGDTPRAAPAAPGEMELDSEQPDAAMDPAAERERVESAAARLAVLDKLANLSQEQLAAISRAVDQVSKELNGHLQKELGDLDRRLASVHGGLAPLPALPAEELAHLDADLARITAHLQFSPADMSHLDAELKKLASEAPRLSRLDIRRIEKEVQQEMQRHPNGGLTPAEIEHLKADAARAIEESRAALAQALPPAEREKILAEARRLAAQAKPDKAQAEALRHLERERQDITRILEKQRADLESMRRDIEREAAAYRDLARRESEAHRIRPHSAPAAPAAPKSAPSPPAAAPRAPEDSTPPAAPPR